MSLDTIIAIAIILIVIAFGLTVWLMVIIANVVDAAAEGGKKVKDRYNNMSSSEKEEFYKKTSDFLSTAENVTRGAAKVAEAYESAKTNQSGSSGGSTTENSSSIGDNFGNSNTIREDDVTASLNEVEHDLKQSRDRN